MSHARECQKGHRTVRSTTAMVAVCSKCDCVFRGRFARQCASPSRSCPHIAPSMSDGSRSFFDFHTGDRCSFERYCCITAVARLLLHHFALFAASNCVSCRAFALRCTQVFVTHQADSQKVSKLYFFFFEDRTCDSPFCNFGLGLRVIDCMVPRCSAAVMATIMQRFLLRQAIAKWRQQGHPRIWDDVFQEARWCKQSGVRT